jgi:hypothetical protein
MGGRQSQPLDRYAMDRLDKHFRQLTQAVFARFGHAYAELLRQWPALAGDALARISRPDRLRQAGRGGGSVLTLRVAPGHAVLVHHDAPRLVERINSAFGYQVVERLKILADDTLVDQPAAEPVGEPAHRLAAGDRLKLKARLKAVPDERLREALGRLGEQGLANGWKIGR